MDEARPIAGASISRSGLMLPDGLRTGPHYEIAGVWLVCLATVSVEYVTVDLDSDTWRLRDCHLPFHHADRTSYKVFSEGM
jgi:hypothetical protein